jgi:hypothetical protein
MSKARPTYLKVSISLDLAQEADQQLLEFFDSVPAGMKANALRRLLVQSLPATSAELQKLLGQVAMDAHQRNQWAGRPRQITREGVARHIVAAPVVPLGSGLASDVRTSIQDRASPELDNELGGHVVPVAGPIVGEAAAAVPQLMEDRLDRDQGTEPSGAASGVPEKKRLNVGKLIPSFAS